MWNAMLILARLVTGWAWSDHATTEFGPMYLLGAFYFAVPIGALLGSIVWCVIGWLLDRRVK
jgi:hypothetical protein